MSRPTHVALIVTCPHCGEPVEISISKKQVKEIYKVFKLPIREAQLKGEKTIEEG